MARLFGTDGVRGIAGEDLTGELAYRVGRATVLALSEHGGRRPLLALGRDTRASGEFLEAALAAGACSAGGDVVQLGVCTTPGVAFLITDLGAQAGVVISASHNPAEYNGIKVFGSTGHKLPDQLEDEIEFLVAEGNGHRARGREVGRISSAPQAHERYLSHLEAAAPDGLAGMRLVVDCANGAASEYAPELFRRLGAEVTAINDRPDGWNINRASGATVPDVVARCAASSGADAGVAHDGDADRAIFADHLGRVVDGDQVLASCALGMKDEGSLAENTVVTTVMANLGFRMAMRDGGIEVIETKVGDRYVLEEMLRTGAVLGGEQSGHLIFLSHATTGDGMLTAIQFLGRAHREGATVAELASCMQRFPQVLLGVPVGNREALPGAGAVWEAVRRAEEALGQSGRVLVRASGTEPLIRVMVEAPDEETAQEHAEAVAREVRAVLE